MMSLADAQLHQVMTVVEVRGARTFRRRLLEMGVVPGTQIHTANIAPMGCPIEFEARKSRLSIRRLDAMHIMVKTNTP